MTVEQRGVVTFVEQKITELIYFGIFKDHCFYAPAHRPKIIR